MAKTISSYWRFLLAGVLNGGQTGAIVPSQRFLIEKMIALVPPGYRGQVLELGPGTGALTLRLAARCPHARILACEINPILAQDFQNTISKRGLDTRVQVVVDSAEHLLSTMGSGTAQQPDFILSGIPLGTLGRESVCALVAAIHRALRPGGLYIQYQHSLIDRKKIKAAFPRLRTVPVLLNFPPAVVYSARK